MKYCLLLLLFKCLLFISSGSNDGLPQQEKRALSFWIDEPCSLKLHIGAELFDLDDYVKNTWEVEGKREYLLRIMYVSSKDVISSQLLMWKVNGIKRFESLPDSLISRISIHIDSVYCTESQITITFPVKIE